MVMAEFIGMPENDAPCSATPGAEVSRCGFLSRAATSSSFLLSPCLILGFSVVVLVTARDADVHLYWLLSDCHWALLVAVSLKPSGAFTKLEMDGIEKLLKIIIELALAEATEIDAVDDD